MIECTCYAVVLCVLNDLLKFDYIDTQNKKKKRLRLRQVNLPVLLLLPNGQPIGCSTELLFSFRLYTYRNDQHEFLRATPAGRANGLPNQDLGGGHKKSISNRESKWAAILVALPNFSSHSPIWWPSIWTANCGPH